jgi:hypothetical protein
MHAYWAADLMVTKHLTAAGGHGHHLTAAGRPFSIRPNRGGGACVSALGSLPRASPSEAGLARGGARGVCVRDSKSQPFEGEEGAKKPTRRLYF